MVLRDSRPSTDPLLQHYDDEHRMIKCPECDSEFKTQKGVDQARI